MLIYNNYICVYGEYVILYICVYIYIWQLLYIWGFIVVSYRLWHC